MVMFEKKLQWHGIHMRIEDTWRGIKQSLPRTEHPKISSKAINGNGCGVSNMETILLEALSSTSMTDMKYAKMRKLFLVPLYALFVTDRHFMKKRNKIHSLNAWK